jgi:hypothetical protein
VGGEQKGKKNPEDAKPANGSSSRTSDKRIIRQSGELVIDSDVKLLLRPEVLIDITSKSS